MFNFFKKKTPTIKGLYVLTFTAEEMEEEELKPVLSIAEQALKKNKTDFAKLWEFVQEDTTKDVDNKLYNAEMHNPQTMQVAMDTWLIGKYGVSFKPDFEKNFFPHAMRDPQGRENFFLYYFDVELPPPPKKFSLIDMFE